MTNTIHALLVGINAYPQSPLNGCVPDTLAVGAFFQQFSRKNELQWRPKYLLAPHAHELESVAALASELDALPERALPTRQGLIDAFDHLCTDAVKPGDVCLFYYSGHGSQESAAPEFAHLKSDGMNETLVCLDSRSGSRDLLDKELAYLIHRVYRNQPEAHVLVITDSCHSGSGTRGEGDGDVRVRHAQATYAASAFQNLLGVQGIPVTDQVFDLIDGKAFYAREARHIHLAAARDSELAKEMRIEGKPRGVFTHCLLRVLQEGGAAMSYPEIARRTGALVRNRVSDQIPQVDAWGGAQLHDGFLGGHFEQHDLSFPILFEKGEWQLKGGALQGIVAGTPEHPTTVKVEHAVFAVKEVLSTYSVLDVPEGALNDADVALAKEGKRMGVIQDMAAPKISIFIDVDDPEQRRSLDNIVAFSKPVYCRFDAASKADADYVVRTDANGKYMLLKKDNSYPVFMRQEAAGVFVSFCDGVGKWRFVQELDRPPFEGLRAGDIDIRLEVLDNISPDTIQTAQGVSVGRNAVKLTYRYGADGSEEIPALRCTVKINKPGYYVGGLYLDNECGVTLSMKPQQTDFGQSHTFDFHSDGATFNAIPLFIRKEILQRGVREITEYLKVFVSNQYFELNNFVQPPLPIDVEESDKRGGFGQKPGATKPDWCVITIPVRIVCPSSPVELTQVSGGGFRITGKPAGFSAKATLCTVADVRDLLKTSDNGTRGVSAEMEKFVLPPASLWGDTATESGVFSRSFEVQYDEAVSILQLTEVFGELTEPLRLELDEKAGADEVIVPYGYDAETDLYLPMGYTNENGDVEIIVLPDATPGILGDGASDQQERGVFKAVKLFFKKMRYHKLPNTLMMIQADGSRVTDVEQVRAVVSQANSILFVTHGNLVNIEDKIEQMTQLGIAAQYDVFLAYEYEALNTPLEKTAGDMLARLKSVDACLLEKGARITMVAPSMGGLVCRWMVEQSGGGAFVQHVLLVGSPSLGSDLSGFHKKIFSLLGRALNGVAVLKPYIVPLSYLAKTIGKAVFVTIDQQNPKSDFIKKLNAAPNKPATVRYSLLGGDSTELDRLDNKSAKFYKRLKRFVVKKTLDWFVFDEPHDWLVEVSSQKGPNGLIAPQDITIIPADHLSYFVEDNAIAELKRILGKEAVA